VGNRDDMINVQQLKIRKLTYPSLSDSFFEVNFYKIFGGSASEGNKKILTGQHS
jgi:hypothetical protein